MTEAQEAHMNTLYGSGAGTGPRRNGRPVEDTDPPAQVDNVNHPSHYTQHPSGVECIQITEHMTFNLGNVMKYIWRAGQKGPTVEDLKKAQWYLSREIDRLTRP